MSSSEALPSSYINRKSGKREILPWVLCLSVYICLASISSTRFHINKFFFLLCLGTLMLLLFIRHVVVSPSSSNIYAFYFLRHLFAASSSHLQPYYFIYCYSIHTFFFCHFHFEFVYASICYYLDQLFFRWHKYCYHFRFVHRSFVFLSLFFFSSLLWLSQFFGVHVIFIYLYINYLPCLNFEYMCIVICPNEMLFRGLYLTFLCDCVCVWSSYIFPHQFAVFCQFIWHVIRMCRVNAYRIWVYRKCKKAKIIWKK